MPTTPTNAAAEDYEISLGNGIMLIPPGDKTYGAEITGSTLTLFQNFIQKQGGSVEVFPSGELAVKPRKNNDGKKNKVAFKKNELVAALRTPKI